MSLIKKIGVLFFVALLSLPNAFAEGSDEFNFRFSPLGLVIGLYSVTLDYAVAPDWTVGPTLHYLHWDFDSSGTLTNDLEVTGFGLGARANWFSNGVYTDGWYVGPGLEYISAEAEATDINGTKVTAETSVLVARVLGGYGWFWDSFNMMLGLGVGAPLGDNEIVVRDSNGEETSARVGGGLTGEFSLGWTF